METTQETIKFYRETVESFDETQAKVDENLDNALALLNLLGWFYITMQISFNIEQLQAHCDILREEQREVEELYECMRRNREIAFNTNLTDDVAFWEKQLKILQNQRQYIQNRISLLEQMAIQFTRLSEKTEEQLEQIKSQFKNLNLLWDTYDFS